MLLWAPETGTPCWRVVSKEGSGVHTCMGTRVLEGGVIDGHFINTDGGDQAQFYHAAATVKVEKGPNNLQCNPNTATLQD